MGLLYNLQGDNITYFLWISLWDQVDVTNNWIYHKYANFFYKPNFEMYFISCTLFKWNKWEVILELFSKFYTYKMKTCQISNHLRENTFKCHCFNIQNTFLCKQNDLMTWLLNIFSYDEFWHVLIFYEK